MWHGGMIVDERCQSLHSSFLEIRPCSTSVDRSDATEISAMGDGLIGFRFPVGTDSNEQRSAGMSPYIRDRQIALSQMDTIGIRGQRDINPVIDDHAASSWPCKIDQATSSFQQDSVRQILFSELDAIDAGGDGF